MNIKGLKEAMIAAREINKTLHLIGEHGTGKSSVIRQLLEAAGYAVVDVRLGQMADAGDIIGLPEFHTDLETKKKFTKYVLPDFFPRTKKVVIFLDEINRSSKDLLQAVFELVLDKSLKGNLMPEDCHVIAASNPATDDYAVLDFSDSAFQDRFIHIKFTPSEQEFFEYCKAKYPTSAALSFVQEDKKSLSDGGLQSFNLDFVKPSRRSWEGTVMPLEAMYDAGKLDKNVFYEMVNGVVGATVGTAYKTYKENHVSSIKAADVMEDYSKVRDTLLKIKAKGRTDILGNLLQDFTDEFTKRDGLELSEANNIIDCMGDLDPERAYTLGTIIVDKQQCTKNVRIPAGVTSEMSTDGLLNSDRLEALFAKVKVLRAEGQKEIEEAKNAPKKARKKKDEL